MHILAVAANKQLLTGLVLGTQRIEPSRNPHSKEATSWQKLQGKDRTDIKRHHSVIHPLVSMPTLFSVIYKSYKSYITKWTAIEIDCEPGPFSIKASTCNGTGMSFESSMKQ